MEELWKDIEGYEGFYQVSNFGRVKVLERLIIRKSGNNYISKERLRKLKVKDNKYLFVNLSINGVEKHYYVHRLVLFHFGYKGGCENLQVNHIDFDVTNNRISNLEWVTHRQNISHRISNNRILKGETVHNSKLTEEQVVSIKKELNSITCAKLAKKYEVSPQLISRIKVGKAWKHI